MPLTSPRTLLRPGLPTVPTEWYDDTDHRRQIADLANKTSTFAVSPLFTGQANARVYQAVADGVTDDSPKINAAIGEVRRVRIPYGTYRCTSAISPVTNTELVGNPQDRVDRANSFATVIESSASKIVDLGTSGAHTVVLRDLHLKPVSADQANTYGIFGVGPVSFEARGVVITDQAIGVSLEKSQEATFDRTYVRSCGAGMEFKASATSTASLIYNVNWFNNLVTIKDSTIIAPSSNPNIDFRGQGLMVQRCDISGIPNSGTRASVRIRALSYDATIQDFYFEPQSGQSAGGDVFLCEGGVTRIKGGFCQGGASGTRVANVISAKNGAIVIAEGITGFDYFDNFVTADGAGTIVYVMPGCFGGAMVATNRFVETNGGKVIDITTVTGSFTATLTGVDSVVTGTVNYQIHNEVVTIFIPGMTGTSNATTATLTGAPAAITPASTNVIPASIVVDSGANFTGAASIGSSGVIGLFKTADLGATGFTNSGTKGVVAQVLTYTLF